MSNMWRKDILAALERCPDARVLSIQSHVVHGHVGNCCSVFPLQLYGFNVDVINSVQLSNHLGHAEFSTLPTTYQHCEGQRLTNIELQELYRGLKQNGLASYNYILTGYSSSQSFLKKTADIVADIKLNNPEVIFICDPVLGDNGRYYVPQDLVEIYKDVVVPVADVVTPNAFELGELTEIPITSEKECLRAIKALHDKGPRTVVVTSGVPHLGSENRLVSYVSVQDEGIYRISYPKLPGQFVGTGDVFTSLLLVWMDIFTGDIIKSMPNIISSMQALIQKTIEHAQQMVESNSQLPVELRLIESRKEILFPEVIDGFQCFKIE